MSEWIKYQIENTFIWDQKQSRWVVVHNTNLIFSHFGQKTPIWGGEADLGQKIGPFDIDVFCMLTTCTFKKISL